MIIGCQEKPGNHTQRLKKKKKKTKKKKKKQNSTNRQSWRDKTQWQNAIIKKKFRVKIYTDVMKILLVIFSEIITHLLLSWQIICRNVVLNLKPPSQYIPGVLTLRGMDNKFLVWTQSLKKEKEKQISNQDDFTKISKKQNGSKQI